MASGGGHAFNRVGSPLVGLPLGVVEKIGMWGGGHGYVSHFYEWEGPTAEGSAGGWTLSGVTDTATIDHRDESNTGTIRLTCGAAADANAYLELAIGRFTYNPGKRLWCFASIALSDADDMEAYFGLGQVGVTDFIATLPTHGFFFEKAETAVDFDFHCRNDGTSSENAADLGLTLADDTFVTVGFVVNIDGTIIPYTGTLTSPSWTAGTTITAADANLPSDSGDSLTIGFGIETGDSAADYMDIDWVVAWQEA